MPALFCWLILRRRKDTESNSFGGEYDSAPLNPIRLREYTPTGEIDYDNPPPGYTSSGPPRD
jgi:hypothetical protein